MSVLPPGTVLQHLYLRRRLRAVEPGSFVEVGTGAGHLSRELLRRGWRGSGWDLSADAIARAQATTAGWIQDGRFLLHHGDWLDQPITRCDLVVSAMVLEHLSAEDELRFLDRCRETADVTILFVPGSPAHWGIEDDIAGHQRRYTRTSLRAALDKAGLRVRHLAGLTFPLSNLLLPVSNRLVRRGESDRLGKSAVERTQLSGARDVAWKTNFPSAMALLLNERTLFPFHVLQCAFRGSAKALVLYVEAESDRALTTRP